MNDQNFPEEIFCVFFFVFLCFAGNYHHCFFESCAVFPHPHLLLLTASGSAEKKALLQEKKNFPAFKSSQ